VEAARAASRRPRRRPPRYSALALLRHGLSGRDWPRAWPDEPLRNRYDVVIVGGGVHGLAAAYYLAVNHGITDVAARWAAYIGGGGSGRSTAILRSNFLTPEGSASTTGPCSSTGRWPPTSITT
jgi:sarcosine oxidase subunit beta